MNKISLFLDSGAFSAFTKGAKIDIHKYIDFIKKHKNYIDVYANLDVIGDAEASWKNQKIMEEQGLSPLPVFHTEDDFKYLDRCLNDYDHFCIGGMAKGFTTQERVFFLDKCFAIICDTADKIPEHKVHGFGMTSLKLMFRYPWYSVDSTSWVMTSRMGGVMVPRYKSGEWIYDEQSWKISVSSRSPDKSEAGKHIDTFSEQQKQYIFDYFSEKGYILGESKFELVLKTRKLKEGERWNGPATGSEREIEIIIESGLCNDYKLRDELNIIYYLDLEKSMPAWPWAFKVKGVKEFDL